MYSLVIFVWYRIDCINYFVHREMNLKNRIAYLMKERKKWISWRMCVRFGFLDSFLNEQNILYSQCSILWTDSTFDHTKWNVPEIQLEMNTCFAEGMYISPQNRILTTKRFFAHQWKGKKKHPEFKRYCNICNYNIYTMLFLYSRQLCLFMDR